MRQAHKLAAKFRGYFEKSKIVSRAQILRMKDVELVSELLVSVNAGGLINKKAAIDKAIASDSINGNTLKRIVREFIGTMNNLRRVFPKLEVTRFSHITEFYSLFMLAFDLQQQKLVLTDSKRNNIAQALLQKFSNGVDDVRERQKRLKGTRPDEMLYTRYLLSVQQGRIRWLNERFERKFSTDCLPNCSREKMSSAHLVRSRGGCSGTPKRSNTARTVTADSN